MPVRMSDTSSDRAVLGNPGVYTRPKYLTYEEGAILTLRANDLGDRLLTVRLLKLFQPFSFSCVMRVDIIHGLFESDNVNQRAILKLYDRRFAAQLRRERGIATWSPGCEDAYLEFVNSGEGASFQSMLQQTDTNVEPETNWSQAEKEAYLQLWCSDMFSTELEVYQHLSDLQGREIPQVFSSVAISVRKPTAARTPAASTTSSLLQVRGLLMEDVPGRTLTQMSDWFPQQHWQVLVENALGTLGILSDHGVVNEDVRAANIIVSPASSGSKLYRIVMVDFVQCSIRQSYLTDSDWEKVKLEQDQEGALFREMSAVLKRVGFNLQSPS